MKRLSVWRTGADSMAAAAARVGIMEFLAWRLLFGVGAAILVANGSRLASAASVPTPRVAPVSARDLGMPRYQIARDDSLLWIFNGRGKCHPLRYSLTGFAGLNHVEGDGGYRFRFDFLEKRSGARILDNVSEVMNTEDPLGWNFRAGAPLCLLAQDETWYPHFYRRVGTFHKHLKTGTVSFAIETRTFVSARNDEVLMAVELENRDSEPLTLTLLAVQNGQNLLQVPYGGGLACVAADLAEVKGQGLEWTLPPKARQTRHFAVSVAPKDKAPPVYQAGLGDRVKEADADGEAHLRRIVEPLPVLKTQSPQLDNLYKRCLASLAFCRWERGDFRRQHNLGVRWLYLCGDVGLLVFRLRPEPHRAAGHSPDAPGCAGHRPDAGLLH